MNPFRRALRSLRSTITQPVAGVDHDGSARLRDYPFEARRPRR